MPVVGLGEKQKEEELPKSRDAAAPSLATIRPAMGLLLTTQTDEIFRTIQKAGFDPREFRLDRATDSVTYIPKKEYACDIGEHYVRYRPGANSAEQIDRAIQDWTLKRESVRRWLVNLRRELEAEDLWASLPPADAIPLGAASEGADNRLLTPEEQRRIAEGLRQLLSLSKELGLLPAQITRLEERVDYLVQNSARFGKRDFLNLVSGTLVNFFLSAAVPPDAARALFGAALNSLNWLFGHLLLGSPQPLLPG